MSKSAFNDLRKTNSGGGGDANIVTLGDSTKVRILEPAAEQWLQHDVEGEDDTGTPVFRSVVCSQGPECPLCAKGRKNFPIKRRYAVNVLTDGEVKILMGGKAIFVDGFGRDAEAGFDIMDYDFLIKKKGQGRSTAYDVVRLDRTPRPEVDGSKVHDLSRYSDPITPEKVFEILDSVNIDYDSLEIPSVTREEATAMVMPFGKHKGTPLPDMISEDMSYVNWFMSVREAEGDLANELYIAFRALLGLTDQGTVVEREGFHEVEAPTAAETPATPTADIDTPSNLIVCPVPGCTFKARTPSGFTLHMKSKHPDYKADAAAEPEPEEPSAAAPAPVAPQESAVVQETPPVVAPEPAPAPAAAAAPTRDELIQSIKNIFMTDTDRFGDFTSIAAAIGAVKKGTTVLKDLNDAELNKLYISLAL